MVEPRPQSTKQQELDPRFRDDVSLGLLVSGKKLGLSFAELNTIGSLENVTSFIELWAGLQPNQSGKRRATQADIDRLLG